MARYVHETKVPEVTLGFWIIKIFATTLEAASPISLLEHVK
jgi:uncharacterized membrane-anchored protein